MTAIEHPFDFMSRGIRLAGTLALPATNGPHPAALLLSGSGPLDRDSNTAEMRLDVSKAIAAGLVSQGIASLRYDKRGVGASGGYFVSAGFDDETADARAALDALHSHPSIHRRRPRDAVGHSVGATAEIRLAGSSPPPSGYVLLGGAATTGLQVMEWQTRRIAATFRRPRWVRARVFEGLQARHRASMLRSTTDTVRLAGVDWNARWFREYMAYEPTEALANIDGAVLAITGAKDIQVDPDDVARIGQIVRGAFDGEVPNDLTHVLRRDPGPPSLRAYRTQFQRPVDPWVVQRIADWSRSLLG